MLLVWKERQTYMSVPHESELSKSFLVNSRCYTLSSLDLLRCHLLLSLMCFSLIHPSNKWFFFPTSSFFLVIEALFLPLLLTLRFHSSLFNKRCLIDNWKSTYLHAFIHTRAQDSNKEAPYLSYQRHFVHVPACRWIIYGDTSAYTDTQYPIGGDADMGCCILCVFTVCVFTLLTAATVEGWRVSRGMVLNGSAVTIEVQLLFCCLYAACAVMSTTSAACLVCLCDVLIGVEWYYSYVRGC